MLGTNGSFSWVGDMNRNFQVLLRWELVLVRVGGRLKHVLTAGRLVGGTLSWVTNAGYSGYSTPEEVLPQWSSPNGERPQVSTHELANRKTKLGRSNAT